MNLTFYLLSLSFAGLRSKAVGAVSSTVFFFLSFFKFVRLKTVFVARQRNEQHSTLSTCFPVRMFEVDCQKGEKNDFSCQTIMK